jgi:hypothetical protein
LKSAQGLNVARSPGKESKNILTSCDIQAKDVKYEEKAQSKAKIDRENKKIVETFAAITRKSNRTEI